MKNRPLCLVCIVLMAAILFCRFFRFPIFGEPELTPETRLLLTEGEEVHFAGILAAREPSGEKTRYTLRKCVVLLHGRELHLGRVMLTAQAGPEGARIGAGVSGKGTVRLLEPAGNPGQFDAAAYYACSRIYCRIWCEEPLLVRGGGGLRETLVHTRERVMSFYLASMPEAPAGIITAMLLGDKSLLTEESRRNFQVGGCLHMLVISGLHVTLLGASVLRILLRIGLGQRPACMLAAALMCLYVLFTGLPVAAVRACIMFLTALLAKTRNLSYD